MVNHKKNFYSRLLYFIILFIIYRQSFDFYNLSLNLAMYSIFLLIFFCYYVLDILNFKNKFKIKDLIYSIIVNAIFLGMFYFFDKEVKIFIIFCVYSLFQLGISFILHNHRKNRINILAIADIEQCEIIKKVLNSSENYLFKGYISEKKLEIDLDYLGKIETINDAIINNEIDSIIFAKNQYVKKNSDLLIKVKLKGIKVIDYFSFLEEFEGKIDSDRIDNMWVLMTNSFNNSIDTLNKRIKRISDLLLSIILFILFLPFMIVTYVLVKCDIGFKYLILNLKKIFQNPAFFQQNRIGYIGN